jgi:hypothetical protein
VLLSVAAYLAAHLGVYAFVLRDMGGLRSERGIFLYHFASAVLAGLVALAFAVFDPDAFGLAGVVLVLSLHGIYSVSFLELWSLAQGGYSLSIIAGVAQAEASGEELDLAGLAAIGRAKQTDRIGALERLGLVSGTEGRIALTSRGDRVAFLLHALRSWVEPSGRSER